jgi:hypothetical protein
MRVPAVVLVLFLAACASVPHPISAPPLVAPPVAEINAMERRLRAALPLIDAAAIHALAAYVEDDGRRCRIPRGTPASAPCHVVPVPGFSSRLRAVYRVHTDDTTRSHVIAIRGTANAGDIFTDVDTELVHDPVLSFQVHRGFQRFATAIRADLARRGLPRPGYSVTLTGHSLGGATALLLGLYLYADPQHSAQVATVITFGQPKVFGNAGALTFPDFYDQRLLRVVHCADPVPIVPVSESVGGNLIAIGFFRGRRVDDYEHAGRSLLLLPGGRYWKPGTADVDRDLPASLRQLIASVRDDHPFHTHQMAGYQAWLRKLADPAAQAAHPRTPEGVCETGPTKEPGDGPMPQRVASVATR